MVTEAQCAAVAVAIDAQKTDAFVRLMFDRLDIGDTNARSVIDEVVTAIARPHHLQRRAASRRTSQIESENVGGFVRKWRARKDSNL